MTPSGVKRNRFLGLAVIMVLACGCSKKENNIQPQPPPPPAKPKPVAPVQKPVSSAAMKAEPALSFASKKDPFKPFVAAPKVPAAARGGAPSGLPILSYDVNQFRLIGIVAGLKENRAMAVDPAGKPYVLKQGMHIGKNNGTITHVTNSYVEVAEQYRDDNGKIRKNVVRLALPRKS